MHREMLTADKPVAIRHSGIMMHQTMTLHCRPTEGVKVMQIPILIEPVAGNGYRARGGEPLALTAEGPTREAALARLKEQLQARLQSGAEIVPLELVAEPHPFAEFVGIFRDDPMLDEWKQAWPSIAARLTRSPTS